MIQNHVSQSPAYWRDRSYFFGYGSPFGVYLGYPWWWPGYGYRFGYSPWFAYGLGGYGLGGYGYGYGYPVPGISVDVSLLRHQQFHGGDGRGAERAAERAIGKLARLCQPR